MKFPGFNTIFLLSSRVYFLHEDLKYFHIFNVKLKKKNNFHSFTILSYPLCSGSRSPGLAADMHFLQDVIAFIGPACAFALEPVARLAAYWNTPIITGNYRTF